MDSFSESDFKLCRLPYNGTFELTLRCNLNCRMCMFRHCQSQDRELAQAELSADVWIDLARQAAEAGTLNLLITGGEPLLRQDFCEIYEGIYRLGFIITLYTNATLVSDRVMETLKRFPPHKIGVTLYGASNEVYERVTGAKNGFDLAVKGIERLKELPSILEFRMTLIKDSVGDADAIRAFIKDKFGENVILSSNVFGSVRGGCMDVESCRLSPEENLDLVYGRVARDLEAAIPPELKGKMRIKLKEVSDDCKANTKVKYSLFGCSGGMESYTVSYDGRLLGCQMLGEFWTDAVKEGFVKAWERFPTVVKLPPENGECASCPHRDGCPLCPAVRLAECKSLDGVPQYICKTTKLLHQGKGGALYEKRIRKALDESDFDEEQ